MERLDWVIWFVHVKLKHFLTRLGFRDKQSCRLCGRNQYIIWGVPDWLWLIVVPYELRAESLCIECFANLAHDEGITLALDNFSHLDFFPAKQAAFDWSPFVILL